jgi:hypothetical protein
MSQTRNCLLSDEQRSKLLMRGSNMQQIRPISFIGKRAKLIPLEESYIPALYETGRDPILWQHSALRVASLEDMRQLVRSFKPFESGKQV